MFEIFFVCFVLFFYYYYYFCFDFVFPTGVFFFFKEKKTINNNKLAEMGLCVCFEPKLSNEKAQGFLHSSLVWCFLY